ncbi:IS5 family transposase [Paraburkholderia diazotrophica]|uniref:Transposase, IS4 family n=1 Tax=Paraburkholderia diazotrophica TaxID=667676 RepID=A0A1H7E3C0_9BURK|nr:IS5 family transposase [Paraburkholderia diazotrophica]SEK06080.1 transposase, IS4 family [Paraburkholderia diazotrophica]
MRGADTFTESLFSVRKLDDFVPTSHPLRSIRVMANEALAKMNQVFAGMYEADIKGGRPSIAPEKLLRAMLLQVLYSIRSERQLMEQTQYNLLFRWFIGLSMDDTVWVPTVFTKNRERLIRHDAVVEFFNEVLSIAQKQNWLSGEHFSVDGTLIQAWAGHKSFVRKDGDDSDNDGGGEGDFKGSKRSNETHASKTDPDARLYRKGKTASELRYMGHTLTDNRHGLVVNARVSCADGHAEREAAKIMINDARQAANDAATQITLGADKGYDAQEFIEACQQMKVAPHVAQNTSGRRSAVADAIAQSAGYAISQQKRKLIEQGFGWAKTVGRMRQVMVRGLKKVDQMFVLNMAAYNLVRMRSLGQVRP